MFDSPDDPGVLDAIAMAYAAGAKVLTSAARLVDFVADVGVDASKFVQGSWGAMKGYAHVLGEKWEDPGPPNFEEKEYKREASVLFPPTIASRLSSDPKVQKIADFHSGVCYYEYKIVEFTQYYEPLLSTYADVESRINDILQLQSATSGRMSEIDVRIPQIMTALPNYRTGDPEGSILRAELASLKEEKASILEKTTFLVDYPVPISVKTGAAPGSTQTSNDRFYTGSTNERVDLRALRRYLISQVAANNLNPSFFSSKVLGNKSKLEEYRKYIEQFAYMRDKLIDDAIPKEIPKIMSSVPPFFGPDPVYVQRKSEWEAVRAAITAKGETLKQGIGFAPLGAPKKVAMAIRPDFSQTPLPPAPPPAPRVTPAEISRLPLR